MKLPWRRARWHITIEAERIRAVAERYGRAVWTGECVYDDAAAFGDAFRALVTEASLRHRPRTAEIFLVSPVFQRRTLADLPPVRRSALRALVGHQASRFFRQNGHRLITDAAWLSRAKGQPRLAVAVAADEPLVTQVLDGVERAGLRVESVHPAGVKHLSLLPADARQARDRRLRRSVRSLAWTVATLWLGVVVGASWRFERERRRVDAELARLADPLAALLMARQEMGKARAMLEMVSSSDHARTRIPFLIRSLTKSLPDSAFLTSVTLDLSGSGQISGSARRPLEVVAQLERNPAFAGPHLQGGTIQDEIGSQHWERFTIVFGEGVR